MKHVAIVLINLFVILFLFIFFEILIRVTSPQIQPQGTDSSLYCEEQFGPSPGLCPGSSGYSNGKLVTVDEYGCRRCSKETTSGRPAWLLIGDSVTMGIGVNSDSTFAARLHLALDSLDVYNSSLIGYSVHDYKNVLDDWLIKADEKNIERITICWTLNDIYANITDSQMPGGTVRKTMPKILKLIRGKSRLYLFTKTLLFDRSKSYYLFDSQFYAENQPGFQQAIQTLTSMASQAALQGIKFDVLLLPYEYQLRENKPKVAPPPQNRLATKLDDFHIINTLDFKSYFKKSKSNFLYGDGIHLSAEGHRKIADILINELQMTISN